MKPLVISNRITNRDTNSLNKYLNDISRIPMISDQEEIELVIRARNGEEKALDNLVCANLRFVVSVAKKYQSRGLPLHDLINEGNLGLVKAVLKYDETRGFKFISYAVWWIRQSIMQALTEKSRLVRLPLNKINAINRIKVASSIFEQNNQREPTVEEIEEILDYPLNDIQICSRNTSWHLSMDEPLINGMEERNLYNIISSDEFESPEKQMVNLSLRAELERMLTKLSTRETFIITMFYGIGISDSLGLEQIADRLKLTPERVRQIKIRALSRLRASSRIDLLRDYI
ncbi:RNA polymerase sigma factor RpoD/SigA [Euzebyella marina]|uniref:RNA polymerase sigma factor RpoD/SigA n=1 Tax=Euzebyella marina TaxID=1761453 RepID=A0A3G2L8R9_9FLAO|nr:RNA polymerase sigma factor RpoD/SigA [Euzebyella marina]AYN68593.1 RNA polymerase sigma factor RpoD/SigA [Euzebyella marina]